MLVRSIAGIGISEIAAVTTLNELTRTAIEKALAEFTREVGAQPLRIVSVGPHPSEPQDYSDFRVPLTIVAPHNGELQPARIEIQGVKVAERRAHYPKPGIAVLDPPAKGISEKPRKRVVAALAGRQSNGVEADEFRSQALQIFSAIESSLALAQLEPKNVVRTWFYIADIHSNYAIFNEVRDQFFSQWGIEQYPASTGIGATLLKGSLISAAWEATAGVHVEEISTSRQPPPRQYGPRFVRANTFRRDGVKTLNISGISSIGANGASLASGQDDEIEHCLESFTDLLDGGGMTGEDIQSLYLYATTPQILAAVERRLPKFCLPPPTLANYADVCRPDLRLEIEGRALRTYS